MIDLFSSTIYAKFGFSQLLAAAKIPSGVQGGRGGGGESFISFKSQNQSAFPKKAASELLGSPFFPFFSPPKILIYKKHF